MSGNRKAADLDTLWRVSRSPPGSETRACIHRVGVGTRESQLSPCPIHGEEAVLNFQAYRQRIPRLLCELHVKDTKVDGYARYQVRIVKSEQTWDGLMAVLADHSTDGRMLSGKVGNQGPRDPL